MAMEASELTSHGFTLNEANVAWLSVGTVIAPLLD
jgi:hypothetical protein